MVREVVHDLHEDHLALHRRRLQEPTPAAEDVRRLDVLHQGHVPPLRRGEEGVREELELSARHAAVPFVRGVEEHHAELLRGDVVVAPRAAFGEHDVVPLPLVDAAVEGVAELLRGVAAPRVVVVAHAEERRERLLLVHLHEPVDDRLHLVPFRRGAEDVHVEVHVAQVGEEVGSRGVRDRPLEDDVALGVVPVRRFGVEAGGVRVDVRDERERHRLVGALPRPVPGGPVLDRRHRPFGKRDAVDRPSGIGCGVEARGRGCGGHAEECASRELHLSILSFSPL